MPVGNSGKSTMKIVSYLVFLCVVIAVIVYVSSKKSEGYIYATINTQGADVDDFNHTTEVLQKHYRRPVNTYLAQYDPNSPPYAIKTYAEQEKTAMDYMRLNTLDMGEKLQFANELRVAGINM